MDALLAAGHDQLLDYLLVGQLAIEIGYTISALVVAGNTFSGFNGIFLGFVYILFTLFCYYGLRKKINRTIFGAILGGATMLLFMSLENAIFWGQYGSCNTYSRRNLLMSDTPSTDIWESDNISLMGQQHLRRNLSYAPACYNQGAMRSVCAFSVFMFLSYIALLALLLYFKNDILGNAPLDEGAGYASVPTTQPAEEAYAKTIAVGGDAAAAVATAQSGIPASADF